MLSSLMYADDTTIYFNLKDFPVHNRHIEINREFDKVNTWLKVNKFNTILDENISWKKHVAMITNKLSKISGVLHRLKYIYTPKTF